MIKQTVLIAGFPFTFRLRQVCFVSVFVHESKQISYSLQSLKCLNKTAAWGASRTLGIKEHMFSSFDDVFIKIKKLLRTKRRKKNPKTVTNDSNVYRLFR